MVAGFEVSTGGRIWGVHRGRVGLPSFVLEPAHFFRETFQSAGRTVVLADKVQKSLLELIDAMFDGGDAGHD